MATPGRSGGAAGALQGFVTPARPTRKTSGLVGHVLCLSAQTVAGANYVLEYKNSMTDSDWRTAVTVPGTGGPITLTDSTATGSARFYRVHVE